MMPRSQRDDYHVMSREQQVVLVRLCTGHNRLNSHMHGKLKLAPSPTCPCGQEDKTTEHILQRCPLHKTTREDVWPVSTSLMTKLSSCKQEDGEDAVIHLLSGLGHVACERQEEEEDWTRKSGVRSMSLMVSSWVPYHKAPKAVGEIRNNGRLFETTRSTTIPLSLGRDDGQLLPLSAPIITIPHLLSALRRQHTAVGVMLTCVEGQ